MTTAEQRQHRVGVNNDTTLMMAAGNPNSSPPPLPSVRSLLDELIRLPAANNSSGIPFLVDLPDVPPNTGRDGLPTVRARFEPRTNNTRRRSRSEMDRATRDDSTMLLDSLEDDEEREIARLPSTPTVMTPVTPVAFQARPIAPNAIAPIPSRAVSNQGVPKFRLHKRPRTHPEVIDAQLYVSHDPRWEVLTGMLFESRPRSPQPRSVGATTAGAPQDNIPSPLFLPTML